MPTGYTSKIYEGKDVSYKEFLMDCAKQFDANTLMRDMPFDSEIPIYKPDVKYYKEQIAINKKQLQSFKLKSLEEIELQIEEEYNQALRHQKEKQKNKEDLKQRYLEIKEEVKKWEPPTPEHVNLKTFALEQLSMSIDADCSVFTFNIEKQDAQDYLNKQIKSCEDNIAYYKEKIEEEIERTNKRNQWNKELFDSLK